MSNVRSKQINRPAVRRVRDRLKTPGPICLAAVLMAGLAGGCSTDVSRFDLPVFGATDGAAPPLPPPRGRHGVGGPPTALTDDSVVRPMPRDGGAPMTRGASTGSGGVTVANLPDTTVAQPKIPPDMPPQKRASVKPAAAPTTTASTTPAAPAAHPMTAKPGETIEVAPGDTLYRIASRHRVPISDLMTANGLQNPTLKPGQKLVIPASTSVATNRVPTRAEASQRATQQAMQTMSPASALPAAAGAATAAGSPVGGPPAATAQASAVPAAPPGGNYTIQPGESFFGIARKHKVKAEELAQVNGITDVAKIKQGQVLKIPGPGVVASSVATAPTTATPAASHAPSTTAAHATAPIAKTVAAAPARPIGATGTKVAALGGASTSAAGPAASAPVSDAAPAFDQNETAAAAKGHAVPAKPRASTSGAQTAAATPAAAGSGATSFRWPVKGKVITAFGPRDDGTHNDGINIAVPAGTDVQAAEGGTVAYAGNELKGYGNLILIRHDENWVSAYAHNDQLLVKRGDKIKRGQVVAKAGKSGTVEQPQGHFELRQGSKPVDPLKHLASN